MALKQSRYVLQQRAAARIPQPNIKNHSPAWAIRTANSI
jgi:hypothetical protein